MEELVLDTVEVVFGYQNGDVDLNDHFTEDLQGDEADAESLLRDLEDWLGQEIDLDTKDLLDLTVADLVTLLEGQ